VEKFYFDVFDLRTCGEVLAEVGAKPFDFLCEREENTFVPDVQMDV
jgi:hypothetical protein